MNIWRCQSCLIRTPRCLTLSPNMCVGSCVLPMFRPVGRLGPSVGQSVRHEDNKTLQSSYKWHAAIVDHQLQMCPAPAHRCRLQASTGPPTATCSVAVAPSSILCFHDHLKIATTNRGDTTASALQRLSITTRCLSVHCEVLHLRSSAPISAAMRQHDVNAIGSRHRLDTLRFPTCALVVSRCVSLNRDVLHLLDSIVATRRSTMAAKSLAKRIVQNNLIHNCRCHHW